MKGTFYTRLENQFEDGFQLKMQLTGFKSQKESKTLQGEKERERVGQECLATSPGN